MRGLLLLCALLAFDANAALAQVFEVRLGKAKLGTLILSQRGDTTTLQTALTQTPLSVFDGSFTADSTPDAGAHNYVAISLSSRKTREISLRFDGARAVETLIEPASEMTPLSDPARVPAGVIDPVRVIAALLEAQKCPASMTFYDGRRVIRLAPTEAATNVTRETCGMSYTVIAGPGHLSPLKISKAKLRLTYLANGATRTLSQITIGAGMFNVTLDRLP